MSANQRAVAVTGPQGATFIEVSRSGGFNSAQVDRPSHYIASLVMTDAMIVLDLPGRLQRVKHSRVAESLETGASREPPIAALIR